ncbi:ABC transporter ATP-binding protein [Poseidonibacter ostreae]|uniref:ATP-binding cassette domain-containing protein n=1 Tax=Poseidonibacter ostreae TaxID=2654171 RepID=A0A6L4WMV3_9BACT|nr:ABC transporter ATP-binding protein [Poseidonibacter ostreae]KAB7883142.1 ATP-binding cassette domain-containing protein [Poseidonibacter ostreae]KAB7884486.1 ATP-binding cassette domain-containing protein [Poseidonibacter ostreae]KAB7888059.1 ATP-binding cassette domain-containing protein [Poseidonibacter ostreae]
MSLLKVQNVSKSFGSLKVTNDLSFELKRGEAIGILGPNGAGKTTLFNLISGDITPDSGEILFNDKSILALSSSDRCVAGFGRTYQIPQPFEGMSVFENVLVGAVYGNNYSEKEAEELALYVLEQTGLIDKAEALAGTLSLLERKRLELAKALSTQPKVLLLDEIAGGLTEQEVFELIELIKDIRKAGVSIIWIEHIVHALLSVVDRLIAINFGELLIEGTPEDVMNSSEVKEVYMGIE